MKDDYQDRIREFESHKPPWPRADEGPPVKAVSKLDALLDAIVNILKLKMELKKDGKYYESNLRRNKTDRA